MIEGPKLTDAGRKYLGIIGRKEPKDLYEEREPPVPWY